MIYLACLLGIIIGGVMGFSWSQAKGTAQLTSILNLLDDQTTEKNSVASQLRRSVVKLQRQRQDLETQLQSWQNLWQSAPIGYLQIDADNQILWCNTRAQQLLDITDWQAHQPRLLLEVVRSFELDQLISLAKQTQTNQELEWQFYPSYASQPVGSEPLMLKASTVFFADRSVGVFLENLQPLIAMNQARERWTTDLAHELRTPLTSLRLMAETIQSNLKSASISDKWSDRMLQEIDRLAKLVQDFLDLSHLEDAPSKSVQRSTINLSDLIDQAWRSVEPLASQKSVGLLEQGDCSVQLQADPNRLMQVMINLLDNALKYSPHGGQIQVKIHRYPEIVDIEIIDEGCGFSPTDLPRVFDRLFRGDVSRHHAPDTTSMTTGNGLGLAIVKQIILAHGGVVTAQNHPETGGGWLQIKLPLHGALAVTQHYK